MGFLLTEKNFWLFFTKVSNSVTAWDNFCITNKTGLVFISTVGI